MRNGTRGISPDALQVLLQSVDVIREMTQSAQDKRPIVMVGADSLSRELARILAQKEPSEAAAPSVARPKWPQTYRYPPRRFGMPKLRVPTKR
jgi:chemotaxis protein histidine kinase CheA